MTRACISAGVVQVVIWFPPGVTLWKCGSLDQSFSQFESPFGAFLQIPSGLSCVFTSVWSLCHKAQAGGVMQGWLSFCKFPPEWQATSTWVLGHREAMQLLEDLLVVPNLMHLKDMKASLLLKNFNAVGCCALPQICASVSELCRAAP